MAIGDWLAFWSIFGHTHTPNWLTASSKAWVKVLASIPNLEELLLTNQVPTSLHGGLFGALLVRPPSQKDWDVTPTVGEWQTMFNAVSITEGVWVM